MNNMFKATSFKLPKKIEDKMLRKIIDDGYGMRGKRRWIIDSIEKLLCTSDYIDLVSIADEMEHLSRPISVRIPPDLMRKIDNAIVEVRTKHPAMEGVKSNIIRASIMQGLIR